MTNILQTAGRTRPADVPATVLITPDGYLRLPGDFSLMCFPTERAAGLRKGGSFILMPATIYAQNGMIIKQRNLQGERSLLIREVWGDDHPVGELEAVWQPTRRRMVITAGEPDDAPDEEND